MDVPTGFTLKSEIFNLHISVKPFHAWTMLMISHKITGDGNGYILNTPHMSCSYANVCYSQSKSILLHVHLLCGVCNRTRSV